MKQLNLSDWKELNNSFPRRLIYHAGIDCGFTVELNYMLNAMLYCLAKGYRFQLYSEDANFGTGRGWTEYFAPFCEEVHEAFHHKYNLHRPPTWRRILRNTIRTKSPSFIFWKLKFLLKTLVGHCLAFKAYGKYVRLSQDVAHEPARYYHIPALGISCSYTEAYAMLARMVWQPQPEVHKQIADAKVRLSLPQVYSGIQIRGGDKVQEARLITGRQIIEALHPQEGDCIFALPTTTTNWKSSGMSSPKCESSHSASPMKQAITIRRLPVYCLRRRKNQLSDFSPLLTFCFNVVPSLVLSRLGQACS